MRGAVTAVVALGAAGLGCASSTTPPKVCDDPALRVTITYPASSDFCDVTSGQLLVDFPSGDAQLPVEHWNQRFFTVPWPAGVEEGEQGTISFVASGTAEHGEGETTAIANPGDCTDVILQATCSGGSLVDAGSVGTPDAGLPDAF
jgi:hypothetical protein